MGIEIASYTAADVETANFRSDSLCAIGVVHREFGRTVYEKYFLVNPDMYFDPYTVDIHGIDESMVRDAPLFSDVWEELLPCFLGGLIVAHNAGFDLGVIRATLARYGIAMPRTQYACTLRLARRHIERARFGSHRLDDLCLGLGVALDHHHDALCDARACADLFDILVDRYGAEERDLALYPAPEKPKRTRGKPLDAAAEE